VGVERPKTAIYLARLAAAVLVEVAEWQAPLLFMAIRLRGIVY
jgi:hypothetical protein